MDTDSLNKPITTSRGDRDAGRGLRSRYRRLWLYSVFVTAFVSLTPLVILTCVNFHQYREALKEEVIHPISRLTSISRRFIDDFLKEHWAALTFVARRDPWAGGFQSRSP